SCPLECAGLGCNATASPCARRGILECGSDAFVWTIRRGGEVPGTPVRLGCRGCEISVCGSALVRGDARSAGGAGERRGKLEPPRQEEPCALGLFDGSVNGCCSKCLPQGLSVGG